MMALATGFALCWLLAGICNGIGCFVADNEAGFSHAWTAIALVLLGGPLFGLIMVIKK